MRIAIIGAGFTGLTAAYRLQKNGHEVTVIERESLPGGLAIGIEDKNWKWTLEKYYHHLFTGDYYILRLAKELDYNIIIKRPKTSIFIDQSIFQLDSPMHILKIPALTLLQRINMAMGLAALKYNPFWRPLEKVSITSFLPKIIGGKAYEKIWHPQLFKKFGSFMNDISMAWFWARIKARSAQLGYPERGFLEFAKTIVEKINEAGGKVIFDSEVLTVESQKEKVSVKVLSKNSRSNNFLFDKVIVTLSTFDFMKIAPQLPSSYKQSLEKLKGLGSSTLILRLNQSFLKDGTYWLSICDKKSPITAIVEHTNFIDKENYNNEHIVYLGNYLPQDHPYMRMHKKEILEQYDPYLRKINSSYKSSVLKFDLFTNAFAQPIMPLNYSQILPALETPLKNVYLANIQQVYPWDRGTNYAVELGEKIAKLVKNE